MSGNKSKWTNHPRGGFEFACDGCGVEFGHADGRWAEWKDGLATGLNADVTGRRCISCGPGDTEQPKPACDPLALQGRVLEWDRRLSVASVEVNGTAWFTITNAGERHCVTVSFPEKRLAKMGQDELVAALTRDAIDAFDIHEMRGHSMIRAEAEKLAPKQGVEFIPMGEPLSADVIDAYKKLIDDAHKDLIRSCGIPKALIMGTPKGPGTWRNPSGYRDGMRQMATMARGLSLLAEEIFEATHAGMTICTGVSDRMVREGIDPDDEMRLGIRAQYMRHRLAELQAKRQREEDARLGWHCYGDEGEG